MEIRLVQSNRKNWNRFVKRKQDEQQKMFELANVQPFANIAVQALAQNLPAPLHRKLLYRISRVVDLYKTLKLNI